MLDLMDRVKAIFVTNKVANINSNKDDNSSSSYLPADRLEPPTTGPAPALDQLLVPRRPLSVIVEEDVLPDTDFRQPGEGQELDLSDKRDHVVGADVHTEPTRDPSSSSLPLEVLFPPALSSFLPLSSFPLLFLCLSCFPRTAYFSSAHSLYSFECWCYVSVDYL